MVDLDFDFEIPQSYKKLIPYAVCLAAAAIIIAILSGGESAAPRSELAADDTSPLTMREDEVESLRDRAEKSPQDAFVAYETYMSRQLEAILSYVRGAGEVHAQVMLDFGPAFEYHQGEETSETVTEEEDAQGGTRDIFEKQQSMILSILRKASGDEKPVVRRVEGGEIRGVLVVATGADDVQTRANLKEAVTTLLDVPSFKVTVLPGERGN